MPPKVTLVAPVKPVPVMVTVVPPANVPDVGKILVNVGAGATVVVAAVVGNVTVKVSVLPVPDPDTAPAAAVPVLTVGVKAVENVLPAAAVSVTVAV